MANEVVPFSKQLTESLVEVQTALPNNFNVTRFVQNSIALLNDNEMLAKYARQYGTENIKVGLMKGAYLGLDAMNKEFYLIPYQNQLQFMVDYKGNVKLAKKYSIRPIKDIYAKLVREGDVFEEEIVNGEPTVNFKPMPFNDGEIVGAFAVCLFQDGGMIYDSMSLKDLENTRSASKAKNSPAYTRFLGEMYKKTVLHRLCKHIELEFDNPKQIEYFGEDMRIETDPKKIADSEIEDSANSEEFIESTYEEL